MRALRALALRFVLGASLLASLAASASSRADVPARANDPRANDPRTEDREHTIKAAFLLNFIRYATWPKTSFEGPESPIRVLVVGRDPFGEVLEATFRGEKVRGRAIEVARSAAVPVEVTAHVLFCGELARGERELLLARCRAKPILLVGEFEGFAQAGACINFYLQDQKTRFEINVDALSDGGLELSPDVLKLARIVRTRREGG